MLFAFINDNKIVKIEEYENSSLIIDSHMVQQVIEITSISPQPKIGWLYSNGVLKANIPDVTPRQIRQALILNGVSVDMIEAALNSLPEPNRSLAITEWEYSTMFLRSNKLVSAIGQMLGWGSGQLDALWLMAAKL